MEGGRERSKNVLKTCTDFVASSIIHVSGKHLKLPLLNGGKPAEK